MDKAKLEAEDAQRTLIGALNGLAALAAIESDIPLAVSIYREALAQTEENAGEIDVDLLQKLHTLHNLADVLGLTSSHDNSREKMTAANGAGDEAQLAPAEEGEGTERTDAGAANSEGSAVLTSAPEDSGTVRHVIELPRRDAVGTLFGLKIPRTLRDDVLVKQSQEIKSKYMASFHAKLASGVAEFESANLQVRIDVVIVRNLSSDPAEVCVLFYDLHFIQFSALGTI